MHTAPALSGVKDPHIRNRICTRKARCNKRTAWNRHQRPNYRADFQHKVIAKAPTSVAEMDITNVESLPESLV